MAEVTVHLWAGLRHLTGGVDKVTLEAKTIGNMLDALAKAHPGLEPILQAGVSVAIDGEIITGSRHRALEPGCEVFLMQRMKGG